VATRLKTLFSTGLSGPTEKPKVTSPLPSLMLDLQTFLTSSSLTIKAITSHFNRFGSASIKKYPAIVAGRNNLTSKGMLLQKLHALFF
jgi:hypothetical protein